MYTLAKLVVLLSVALSVSAIPSHYARDSRAHHAIAAARRSSPLELVRRDPLPAAAPRVLRKRSSGSCIPRNGSSTAAPPLSSTSTSSSTPLHSSSSNAPPSSTPSSSTPSFTPQSNIAQSTNQPAPSTTTTQPAPPASTSSGANGGSSQTFTGDGTYYGTGLGACGITNVDTDLIAAVAESQFDSYPGYNGVNPNTNPICNKKASVNYQGKNVEVTITDRCTGCAFGALDFSPSAFSDLASQSVGRIHGITWSFV